MFIRFCLLLFVCLNCSSSENYKDAYFYTEGEKNLIKLKGTRKSMVHNPTDITENHMYEDSIILQVPSLNEGTIMGKDIPVRPGKFAYKGQIQIHEKILEVGLLVDDTSDKELRPLSWNGLYDINRK